MSTPVRRSSAAHVAAIAGGPSSSLLQQLLDEINDNNAPRSDPIFSALNGPASRKSSLGTSRKVSLNCTIASSLPRRTSSVWAKGGWQAEDARQKLRAFDEDHLRKQSKTAAQPDDPTGPPVPLASIKTSTVLPSPPFFTEIQYNRTATFPAMNLPSPTEELEMDFPRGKRERSGAHSPDFISKRLRQQSFPDMTCRNREYRSPNFISNRIVKGGGSTITTRVQSATVDDPVFDPAPSPQAPCPPSPLYGFRTTPQHAYKSFRPATPSRSPTPPNGRSPSGTPTWAQPFQLVEDEVSIYKNVHGDKPQQSPLCLYCFRQHGEFHRMVKHRCGVCGQSEALEGHYWEEPFWAQ